MSWRCCVGVVWCPSALGTHRGFGGVLAWSVSGVTERDRRWEVQGMIEAHAKCLCCGVDCWCLGLSRGFFLQRHLTSVTLSRPCRSAEVLSAPCLRRVLSAYADFRADDHVDVHADVHADVHFLVHVDCLFRTMKNRVRTVRLPTIHKSFNPQCEASFML